MARILIVEDEQRIASFVAKGLRAEGHATTVIADGKDGLDHALSGDYDLMVLDIGLPRLDGFDVLDQLRSQGSRMPVIVLTARDSVTDTVSALEGGADDYMPKPFRFAELLARVRLRLRQTNEGDGAGVRDVLEAGGVRLDLRTRRATVGGQDHDLLQWGDVALAGFIACCWAAPALMASLSASSPGALRLARAVAAYSREEVPTCHP